MLKNNYIQRYGLSLVAVNKKRKYRLVEMYKLTPEMAGLAHL